MSIRVAIQGAEGCYHDAAAREYFAQNSPGEEIVTVPFDSFGHLFDAANHDASLLATVAIENTIAGPLLQNHELLRESPLTIVGEHKMRISHVLAALPGQKIEDIKEVHSHPMALMQCEQFLHMHPHIRMVENFDTAGSAREIAEAGTMGHAAERPCRDECQSDRAGFHRGHARRDIGRAHGGIRRTVRLHYDYWRKFRV